MLDLEARQASAFRPGKEVKGCEAIHQHQAGRFARRAVAQAQQPSEFPPILLGYSLAAAHPRCQEFD